MNDEFQTRQFFDESGIVDIKIVKEIVIQRTFAQRLMEKQQERLINERINNEGRHTINYIIDGKSK